VYLMFCHRYNVEFVTYSLVWLKCTFQWYFCFSMVFTVAVIVIVIVIAMYQKLSSQLFDTVRLTTERLANLQKVWPNISGICITPKNGLFSEN